MLEQFNISHTHIILLILSYMSVSMIQSSINNKQYYGVSWYDIIIVANIFTYKLGIVYKIIIMLWLIGLYKKSFNNQEVENKKRLKTMGVFIWIVSFLIVVWVEKFI